jgi:putative flavoprotein involved in K+ transport
MAENDVKKTWDTIVIGAGQAGLATGYYLTRAQQDFVILDAGAQLGDSWRRRWDSLRLFTPSQYDSLPGLAFPAKRGSYPTKDDMADYLKQYAQQFSLPIMLNAQVTGLDRASQGFEVTTSTEKLTARQVVVATGANPVARIPELAKDLDRAIYQVHSSQYRNPEALPDGDVLVVGAGMSGVEIALEISRTRHTFLSGHPHPHIPDPIFQYAGGLFWLFINNVLTIRTPIGRKARSAILRGGGPLIRASMEDVDKAGIERLPRVTGVDHGHPQPQDGRVLSVASIVWATGYRPDFSWIHLAVVDESGWPRTRRGVAEGVEGLYFVGMLFQFGLTSGLVGGVGRDAQFVVEHIRKRGGEF